MNTETEQAEPIDEAATDLAKFDTSEHGVSALKQSNGYILEEFLEPLKGPKAVKVYRQMRDNDPVVGAILFACNMLIRQVEWRFDKADDSDQAVEMAELAKGMFFDDMAHSWTDFITEVCTMFEFGYAPMEPVLKKRNGRKTYSSNPAGEKSSKFDDGLYGLHKLALRAQESVVRWKLAPNGDILGLTQQPETGAQIDLDIENFVLFRTQAVKNNPEGRSILRNAYRPWFYKTRHEEIEAIGMERDMTGYPVMMVPGDLFKTTATADQKRTLLGYTTMVKNIRQDKSMGSVLPSTRTETGELLYELKLMSSGGTRAFDTNAVIGRYAREIAMTVLADFIFLGQSSTGSFALSSDKTELFSTAIGGFLQRIAEPINNIVLPAIWAINGVDYDLMPTLCHGDIETISLTEICTLIDSMVGAGVALFPDRDLENTLRGMAGLPEAADMGDGEQEAAIRRDKALYGDQPQADPAGDPLATQDDGVNTGVKKPPTAKPLPKTTPKKKINTPAKPVVKPGKGTP